MEEPTVSYMRTSQNNEKTSGYTGSNQCQKIMWKIIKKKNLKYITDRETLDQTAQEHRLVSILAFHMWENVVLPRLGLKRGRACIKEEYCHLIKSHRV